MLELRPIDPEADLDALFAIAYASDALATGEPETTRADIHHLLTSPQVDHERGSRKVQAGERTVGFVVAEVDGPGETVFLDTYVDPVGDVDDEREAWDTLLAHGVAFAQSCVRSLPAQHGSGWGIGAGCYEPDERYAAVLARWDLQQVRRFHRMEITFDEASPPAAPVPPAGVQLVAAGDDERLLRTAHAVVQDAFDGAWRHVHRPYDDWMDYFRNESFDPAQWWIAYVDGDPAGVCLGNDHLAELGLGYVSMLGVLPAHRGRGLARLMLQQAFAQDAAAGRRGTRLGVDTDNDTGALELYTSVGMTPVETIVAWRRPL